MRRTAAIISLFLSVPALAVAQVERPPLRLVLTIVADQLPPGALDQYRSGFTGGLARILNESLHFPNGEQDHALTDTGPGHASIGSGRFPAHHGIISNGLSTDDPTSPLLHSTGMGMSPRRLVGTALPDWMRAHDPATRILAVSTKARGSILLVGRQVAPVYWYSQGIFTTSRYYADSLPTWLQAWNAQDPLSAMMQSTWRLGRPESAYSAPDDRPFEHGGVDVTFPHRLPADRARAAEALIYFSPMDSLILDVALRGFRAQGIGRRNGVDFLSVSLSALDEIAHEWGPGSREVQDHLFNLDRWLGVFLDSLSRTVPMDQMAIVLTSDHGSTEFPETGKGGRLTLSAQVSALNRLAATQWGIRVGAAQHGGLLLADLSALRARGVDVDSLARAMARDVEAMPGVRRAYTPRSLAIAPMRDADAMRWRRHIPRGTEWVIAVAAHDDWVWGSSKTSTAHRSGNLSDRRIPILLRIPGVHPARIARTVRSVDIAPTLAAILGVRPTESVDGVVLPEALRGRVPR